MCGPVDFAKLSLLLAAAVLRLLAAVLATLSSPTGDPSSLSHECATLARWALSFSALACTLRLFAALSLQQEMGVLFLSVIKMTGTAPWPSPSP